MFDYAVGANDHYPNVEIPASIQAARRTRTQRQVFCACADYLHQYRSPGPRKL